MKILVSGSSGFIGQNFLKLNKDLSFLKISLRGRPNLAIPNGVDNVLHLAGKAHDLKGESSVEEYYYVNFELTKQLYDHFLGSQAKKFIFISSVKAAADAVNGVLTEADTPNPKTHYGRSKLLAEEYIERQPLPQGKSYFILRPCMVHGPGNKGNLNLLHQFVNSGLPYPLAAFNNKRSFLSVENLSFIVREILDRDDMPSGIYNLADDDPLSTMDLISLISSVVGKEPRFLRISPKIIVALAKIGDKLFLPFNTDRLGKLTGDFVVSNKKIKRSLGKSLPVSSKDGIVQTIRSFSSNISKV